MSEKGEVLFYVYQEKDKSFKSLLIALSILCFVLFVNFILSQDLTISESLNHVLFIDRGLRKGQTAYIFSFVLTVLILIVLVQLIAKIIFISDEMVLYEGGLEINGGVFLPWQKIESVELFWETARSNSRTYLCIYLKPDGDYKDPPLNRYQADYVINTSWMWNISAEEIAGRCREQMSHCKN